MLTSVRRRLLWGAIIALFTTLIVNAGFYLGLFDELELKTFDIRTRYFRKQIPPPSDIEVILIDELSLRVMNPVVGRWPWPRSIHADVIDFLAMGGAKAIVFDILFTENERGFGFRQGKLSDSDERMAEATRSAGNVYHAAQILSDFEDDYNTNFLNKPLPEDFVKRFSVSAEGIFAGHNNTYYIPFPELYNVSSGIGIVDFSPDHDGVYRRTRLFRHYQGKFYPVLSMVPLINIIRPEYLKEEDGRLTLGSIPKTGVCSEDSEDSPDTSHFPSCFTIPLQKESSYLINMYGDFKPYSISGILTSIQKIKQGELENLPVDPYEFNQKVVFIGGSAVGIEDLKASSLDNKTPGVYLHASIYGNIMQGGFLKYPSAITTPFTIAVLSIIITFGILGMWRLVYQIGLPVFIAFTYTLISFWWFKNDTVLDIVTPLIAVVLSWMGTLAYLSFTEGRDRKKIRKMLEQYVSPTVLSSVVDRTGNDVLKAEVGGKENLTILFSDIRGFTTISESLEAEKVVELLNEYLSEMVDVIFEYDGTLDKFIGDAIMAFWGAPLRVNDHGKRAVETALEMMKRLKYFNKRIMANGFPQINIGVGINTGYVILGNIGSEKKLDYTVIGDNVNLASRMEGLTKEYGCPVLISEATYEALKGSVTCRVVDLVRVKGRRHPVRLYEPLSTDIEDRELIRIISEYAEEGFNLYQKREWKKAIESYSGIMSVIRNDTLSKLFIKRCEDYMHKEPPTIWDGVYIMTKK